MAGCNHKTKSCTSKDCRGLDVPMYCCRCLANGTHQIWRSANPVFFVGILKALNPILWYSITRICVPSPQAAPAFWSTFTLLVCKAKPGLSVLMLEEIFIFTYEKHFFSSSMLNMTNAYELRIQSPIRIINSTSTIHNYHPLPQTQQPRFQGFYQNIPFNHSLRWRLRCPPPHVSQESDQLLLGLMGHDFNEEGSYGG